MEIALQRAHILTYRSDGIPQTQREEHSELKRKFDEGDEDAFKSEDMSDMSEAQFVQWLEGTFDVKSNSNGQVQMFDQVTKQKEINAKRATQLKLFARLLHKVLPKVFAIIMLKNAIEKAMTLYNASYDTYMTILQNKRFVAEAEQLARFADAQDEVGKLENDLSRVREELSERIRKYVEWNKGGAFDGANTFDAFGLVNRLNPLKQFNVWKGVFSSSTDVLNPARKAEVTASYMAEISRLNGEIGRAMETAFTGYPVNVSVSFLEAASAISSVIFGIAGPWAWSNKIIKIAFKQLIKHTNAVEKVTNWTISHVENYGVPKNDVEFISLVLRSEASMIDKFIQTPSHEVYHFASFPDFRLEWGINDAAGPLPTTPVKPGTLYLSKRYDAQGPQAPVKGKWRFEPEPSGFHFMIEPQDDVQGDNRPYTVDYVIGQCSPKLEEMTQKQDDGTFRSSFRRIFKEGCMEHAKKHYVSQLNTYKNKVEFCAWDPYYVLTAYVVFMISQSILSDALIIGGNTILRFAIHARPVLFGVLRSALFTGALCVAKRTAVDPFSAKIASVGCDEIMGAVTDLFEKFLTPVFHKVNKLLAKSGSKNVVERIRSAFDEMQILLLAHRLRWLLGSTKLIRAPDSSTTQSMATKADCAGRLMRDCATPCVWSKGKKGVRGECKSPTTAAAAAADTPGAALRALTRPQLQRRCKAVGAGPCNDSSEAIIARMLTKKLCEILPSKLS